VAIALEPERAALIRVRRHQVDDPARVRRRARRAPENGPPPELFGGKPRVRIEPDAEADEGLVTQLPRTPERHADRRRLPADVHLMLRRAAVAAALLAAKDADVRPA